MIIEFKLPCSPQPSPRPPKRKETRGEREDLFSEEEEDDPIIKIGETTTTGDLVTGRGEEPTTRVDGLILSSFFSPFSSFFLVGMVSSVWTPTLLPGKLATKRTEVS